MYIIYISHNTIVSTVFYIVRYFEISHIRSCRLLDIPRDSSFVPRETCKLNDITAIHRLVVVVVVYRNVTHL